MLSAFLIAPVLSACLDRTPSHTEESVPEGFVKIQIVVPLRAEHATLIAAITKSKDLSAMTDIIMEVGAQDEEDDPLLSPSRSSKADSPPTALRPYPDPERPVALVTSYLVPINAVPVGERLFYVEVRALPGRNGSRGDSLILAAERVELHPPKPSDPPENRIMEMVFLRQALPLRLENEESGPPSLTRSAMTRLGITYDPDTASMETKLRSAIEEPAIRLEAQMEKAGTVIDVDLNKIELAPPTIGLVFAAGRPDASTLPTCEPGKINPPSPFPPAKPGNLLPIWAEINSGAVTIVLCADEPVTFVCFGSERDEFPIDYFFPPGCPTPLVRENLPEGDHTFYIGAVDSMGNSQREPIAIFLEVFPPDIKLPAPPSDIKAKPGHGEVTLEWGERWLSDTDYYNIYYGVSPESLAHVESTRSPEGSCDAIPGLTGEQCEMYMRFAGRASDWTVKGLTNGTPYYFAVTSVRADGTEGSRSAVISATPVADTNPPSFLGLSSATPVSPTQIELSWGQPVDRESGFGEMIFRICRSTSAGDCVSNFAATYTDPGRYVYPATYVGQGNTTFIAGDLLPNTTYHFVVRAVDEGGNEDSNTKELSAATLAPPARLLFQIDGASENDGIGMTASGAGDINGDGKPDIIVGIPSADPNGLTNAGSAIVYSGVDGTLIRRVDGKAPGDGCGRNVGAAGDLNADGRDDFMAVRCESKQPAVYSGTDGSIISPPQLGEVASGVTAPVGDVNADGKMDFAVGDKDIPPGGSLSYGRVTVYSGSDGSVLHRFYSEDATSSYGQALSTAGDVNGDGRADFLVGSYLSGKGKGGAYVYSGADGQKIYTFSGAAENAYFGFSVAAGGDSNKDGRAFVFVGAYGGRSVYAYNQAQGARLWDVQRQGDEPFGYSVSSLRDMNGDGKADVVIGAAGSNSCEKGLAGSAHVYSGMEGTLLLSEFGRIPNEEFGAVVAGIGDVNADNKGDFAVVAPCRDLDGRRDTGSVYVFASP